MQFRELFMVAAFILALPAAGLAVETGGTAQEAQAMKTDLESKLEEMKKAPVGVFAPEYENGQLVRLKLKGEAEVPATMRGTRGDRMARERAELNAKAAFSQFLEQNVVVAESDTEGFIIKEKDGKESAEYLNTSAKTINTLSASLQRGIIVLYDAVEGEGDNRMATAVLGWSKKLVQAAGTAQETMINPSGKKDETVGIGVEVDADPAAPRGDKVRVGDVTTF